MYHGAMKDFSDLQRTAMEHRHPYAQIGQVFATVLKVFSKQYLREHVIGPAVGFYYDPPDAVIPRALAGKIVRAGPLQTPVQTPVQTAEIATGLDVVLGHIGPYYGLLVA
jgi:DNA gyrase inhibitor GyrI